MSVVEFRAPKASVWPQARMDAALEVEPRTPVLWGVRHLQFESTNHCDLACVECPQRLMDRHRQWMGGEVFEAILEKLIRPHWWDSITPHKDGEPLLYPHLRPMLATISKAHAGSFDIYTNGTHFSREFYEFAGTLANHVRILISFHFHDFQGKRYDASKATREILAAIERPQPNVELIFATHKTRYVVDEEAEAWLAYWEQVRDEHPSANITGVHLNCAINPWAGHLEAGEGTTTFESCPYGSAEHLFVGVTGNVLPCCLDLNEDLVLGNIVRDSLEEISERRAVFYRDVAEVHTRAPLCRVCLGDDPVGLVALGAAA